MNHPKTDPSSQATIRLLTAIQNDLFEVKHFLKRHKQSRMQSDDLVFIVRINTPSSQAIIGISKLKLLSQNNFWLHGLYIEPAQRKQGLATQLLRFITEHTSTIHHESLNPVNRIFTFPLIPLEHFYLKNSYQPIEPSYLPEALKSRYQNAKKQHKNWLCMILTLESNTPKKPKLPCNPPKAPSLEPAQFILPLPCLFRLF